MPFSIIGVQKLKNMSSVGKSARHTYRTIYTKNANLDKLKNNRLLVGTRGDVVGDVQRRISEVTDKVRKNGIPCVEFMMTTSPEHWQGKNTNDLKDWVNESMAWLKEKYGDANVVHAMLHMDETSPHIVAYVVPEVGGRLSAKDMVGNKATMKDMHTSYATAMGRFGLTRGIEGSGAEHTTVKEFYAKANQVLHQSESEVKRLGELAPPPESSIFQSRTSHSQAVEEWKGREVGKRQKLVKTATSALLAVSTAREQVNQLKEANGDLTAELERTKAQLNRAYESLSLTKEEIASLRKSDVSLVAQKLGHMGEIRPKENAIDLVKRVGGFTYEESIAWLHNEVGSVLTGALVGKAVAEKDPPRPFTAAENVIKRAVLKQTDALGCDKFRVTIVPEDEDKKPYVVGKSKDKEETFYNRQALVGLIPFLRTENDKGKHINITPMDDNCYYLLLDDARLSFQELEAKGFQPCLEQGTSWKSNQVVFKVPKDDQLIRDAALSLVNDMNTEMGDPKMKGLRHTMRLAGFRNMKAKHLQEEKYPFVEIKQAINRFCQKCTSMIIGRSEKLSTYPQAHSTREI